MKYTINVHKHRFAAWAASRAASVKGSRYSVETGKEIIEGAGWRNRIRDVEKLPKPENMDRCHAGWREKVISEALKHGVSLNHGAAAKLINMYTKICFTCAGLENHPRVMALHPPIDNLLLQRLAENDKGKGRAFWNKMRSIGWSKWSSDEYQDVVDHLRDKLSADEFWKAEEFWCGHQ